MTALNVGKHFGLIFTTSYTKLKIMPHMSTWRGKAFDINFKYKLHIISLFQRSRRHTCGILIGAFPCGIIPMIDELFGTENIEQVYALVIEYLSELEEQDKIIDKVLYDDMCHLKPFSEKAKRADRNQVTKKFAQANKAVDKFHFPGHVSKKCHETCDPFKMSCFNDINSPVCEQTFAKLNKFTQVKGMGAERFLFFSSIFLI